MAKMTNAQLQAQLDAVQEELADARARAEAAETEAANAAAAAAEAEAAASAAAASAPAPGGGLTDRQPPRRRKTRWAVLSVTCIALAGILAPAALVTSWAGSILTDTDRFVATYAPIIDDPNVQEFVAVQTTAAIADQVDIEGIVGAAFDGLADTVGLPPVAGNALDMLNGAAVEAIESLLDHTVRTIVTSDAFSDIWEQSLRTAHTQLVATLSGDPDALVVISDSGVLGVPLGPIVAEVRTQLVAEGVGFASLIPDIDMTIVIVESDALPTVRVAYAVAVGASVALPIVCLVLLGIGILAARRRSNGFIGAGIAVAIPMAIVAGGIAIAGSLIGLIVPVSLVPERVSSVLFWAVASQTRDLAVAVLVIAIAVALIAWFAGSSRVATRLRGAVDDALGAARGFGANRGLNTGRFGRVLHEQRGLVRAGIAIVAGLVIILVRPITVSLVIGTIAVALVVLIIAELLRQDPAAVALVEPDAALAVEPDAGAAEAELASSEPAPTAS